jgi:hypothetical protein
MSNPDLPISILPGSALAPELRLLCACISPTHAVDPATGPQHLDWIQFLALATNHHVLPLVFKALKSAKAGHDNTASIRAILPPDGIPTEVMIQLQRLFMTIAAHNVQITATLHGIQQLIHSHGIDLIPIKGPSLAVLAYGDIAMRQFEDLDLLVRQEDLLRTVDLLEQVGYEFPWLPTTADRTRYLASRQDWSLHKPGGRAHLDLKPVLISHTLSMPQSVEFMAKSCRPLPLDDGQHLIAPGPEAMLLAVCLDGANEMWCKLSSIADVAALLTTYPDGDWHGLFKDAASLGQQRSLLVGVEIATALLGCPLPTAFRKESHQDPLACRLAGRVIAGIRKDPACRISTLRQCQFSYRTRERWRDRWRYVTRLLFVPNAIELNMLALPSALLILHSLIRPPRLAWDALRPGKRRRPRARR